MTSYSPYITRILLGRALRRYRQRASMSLAEAARETGISESKLGKLERAANDAIRPPDIYACSYNYELESHETAHLLDLARGADTPGWYHDFDVRPEFAHFLEMEGAASALHIVELELVSGLFQTEAYLQALRDKRPGTKGGADQGLRARRQEIIFGDTGPQLVYVTSEAALRRAVGGHKVMRDQVLHLLHLNGRGNISVRVIPFSAGAHESMGGAYELMYFADDVFPTTVYLESLHGSHYEDGGRVAAKYEETFSNTLHDAIDIKEFIDGNNELA